MRPLHWLHFFLAAYRCVLEALRGRLAALLRAWGGATGSNRTGFATARLAQPAGRKALNLVVVGSSPTVGVYTLLFGGVKAGMSFTNAPLWFELPTLRLTASRSNQLSYRNNQLATVRGGMLWFGPAAGRL